MPVERFHFDPETHRFIPVRISLRARVVQYTKILAAIGFLAVLVRFATGRIVSSPKEIKLIAEKEAIFGQYRTSAERVRELELRLSDLQMRDDRIYRAYYQMDPIPGSIREAGLGGSRKYRDLEGYGTSDLMIELTRRVDRADLRMDIQSRSFNDLLLKAEEHASLLKRKPSIQPISLENFYWISSVFGYREDPMSHKRTMHYGVDFAGREGLNVYATGDGVVKYIKVSRWGFGREIMMDHGFGYTTRYGHLKEILVHQGQNIKRGMVIARLGSTGKSTGPHLHYEVRLYNRAMNPKHFYSEDLTPLEYARIVNIPKEVDN